MNWKKRNFNNLSNKKINKSKNSIKRSKLWRIIMSKKQMEKTKKYNCSDKELSISTMKLKGNVNFMKNKSTRNRLQRNKPNSSLRHKFWNKSKSIELSSINLWSESQNRRTSWILKLSIRSKSKNNFDNSFHFMQNIKSKTKWRSKLLTINKNPDWNTQSRHYR